MQNHRTTANELQNMRICDVIPNEIDSMDLNDEFTAVVIWSKGL